ncbi:adenosylcobinamide-GDP ribazoletransferase [Rhodobacter ferrooxidans]|uniref:Adenosylcobinamide-GDP ribazoletransferase n=1 Tax=Rhodobacter ferrooxidans TaxID=371731 RepID=C8S488_9RHOB|nr:adenosylcobinamide-GDP ribazoletransferase [Rhodobacter sp. SW2]EEW24202.1 cobalamin-5-phosphate synthase CobS [Rhodobacter sp. SW2]
MTTNDRPGNFLRDLRVGFGLLTRLPLAMPANPPQGAATAWSWPLVGASIGGLAALVAAAGLSIGLTPGVVAALVLGTTAMLTGAMHEDGLADSADGLWGGWDKARRLEIMKDSRIGSYGVLALLIVTLGRWSALSAVLAAGAHWPVLIAVGALSRLPMVLLMAALPNARGSGLSQAVGKPQATVVLGALALGLGLPLLLVGGMMPGMAVLAALACLGLAVIARARIGGQTGDILGASQQLAELAALAVAAAML